MHIVVKHKKLSKEVGDGGGDHSVERVSQGLMTGAQSLALGKLRFSLFGV